MSKLRAGVVEGRELSIDSHAEREYNLSSPAAGRRSVETFLTALDVRKLTGLLDGHPA